MSLKKNLFAWIIWAVYSIVLCVFIATYINAQCSALQFGKYTTIAIVCGTFVCIFGIYKLLCLLYKEWSNRVSISSHSKMLWEVFFALSTFAGAILIRVYWYMHRFSECLGTMQYYEMATIKEGTGIPFISHGASYLYTGMLSTLFSLLGNKQEAGIVMQLVLQLCGILFFYFAIRNMLGKMEAVIFVAVLAFFPAMIEYGFTLTPENLYFFLFAGMFLLISFFKKYEEKGKRNIVAASTLLFFLGVGIGYVSYLDIIGILLLAAMVFVIFGKKRKAGRTIAYVSFAIGGFGISMVGLFFANSFFNHTSFVSVFGEWCNLYFQKFSWNAVIAGPDMTIMGSLAGCIGAAWLAIAFLLKKGNSSYLYMLSVLVLAAFVSFGSQNMSYQMIATAYWAMLAAIGVTSIMTIKQKAREEAVVTVSQITGETKEKQEKTEDESVETESERPENGEEKKQIQFIENPLPLPKKHVKKTMDYKFEPEEHLMKYDIEVSDDDDFDLK